MVSRRTKMVVIAVPLIVALFISAWYVYPLILAPNSTVKETIDIGIPVALSGWGQYQGIEQRRCALIFEEEINAKGGIMGKEVVLRFEDTESKPEIAVLVTERLITREKVDVIVGPMSSSEALALDETAAKYGTLCINPSATSMQIGLKVLSDPEKYWCIFKGGLNETGQVWPVLPFLKYVEEAHLWTPKTKTISLVGEDTAAARTCRTLLGNTMEENGWTVVSSDVIAPDLVDWYPLLTKIKSLNPDVFWFQAASPPVNAAAVKQARELGIDALYWSCYGASMQEFVTLTGEYADYVIYNSGMDLIYGEPKVDEFVQKFKTKYGVIPTLIGACVYDALGYLSEAIERAGSTEDRKVAEELLKTDYVGLMGRYQFMENNHEVKMGADYIHPAVWQFRDGGNRSLVYPELQVSTYRTFAIPPWVQP